EAYEKISPDENLDYLVFEVRDQPLWERIGRARLFADSVLEAQERINARVESLPDELRAAILDLPGFPTQLFVRCLHKVRDILNGALGVARADGSTQRRQHTEAGTLGHYLQDLNVGQAREQLKRLAREVGVSVDPRRDLPLAEIDGQIIRGFL